MSEPLPTEPPAATTAAPFLADRAVLVLGLGASGLAVARWCARAGARVTVADTRETPPQGAALQQEMPQVQLVQASFDAALLEASGAGLVVKSPGLAPAQIAPLLAAARTARKQR